MKNILGWLRDLVDSLASHHLANTACGRKPLGKRPKKPNVDMDPEVVRRIAKGLKASTSAVEVVHPRWPAYMS